MFEMSSSSGSSKTSKRTQRSRQIPVWRAGKGELRVNCEEMGRREGWVVLSGVETARKRNGNPP